MIYADIYEQLMNGYDLATSEYYAEAYIHLVNEVLDDCTQLQRDAWRLHTGVRADGSFQPGRSLASIARSWDLTRGVVREHFIRADYRINKELNRFQLSLRLEGSPDAQPPSVEHLDANTFNTKTERLRMFECEKGLPKAGQVPESYEAYQQKQLKRPRGGVEYPSYIPQERRNG